MFDVQSSNRGFIFKITSLRHCCSSWEVSLWRDLTVLLICFIIVPNMHLVIWWSTWLDQHHSFTISYYRPSRITKNKLEASLIFFLKSSGKTQLLWWLVTTFIRKERMFDLPNFGRFPLSAVLSIWGMKAKLK